MKKVFPLLLMFALLLCGCAQDPDAFRRAYDPWGQAEDESTPEGKSAPSSQKQSLEPLPTHSVTETPAATTEAPVSTMEHAAAEAMLAFDNEEMDYFKSFWPLEEYGMGDMGEFYDLFFYIGEDYLSATYAFKSGKKYKDIKKEMQKYIKGAWTDTDGSFSCENGTAEGINTSCSLEDMGDYTEVSLSFLLDGRIIDAEEILDSHWPQAAMDIPESLEAEPDSRCIGIDSETVYFSYKWDITGYHEAFEWFRESMKGQDDYIYSDRDDYDDEIVQFFIGDIHTTISLNEEYRTVGITYFFCADYSALFKNGEA